VRALVDLLPEMAVVAGDNYNSSPTDPQLMGPEARERHAKGEAQPTASRRIPMVEVPLGATEDRICGTIDIERALSEGVKARGGRRAVNASLAVCALTSIPTWTGI
jgi:magnesium chelatase subunit I